MSRRGDNIRKRTDGRWEGRYHKERDSKGKIKYGSVYGKTYKEVKAKLDSLSQIKEESKKQSVVPCSFSNVLQLWLNNNKIHLKGATVIRYQYLINTHIAPELGKYNVNEITSGIVNTFLNTKLSSGRKNGKGGLSNSYVKSMMLIIKASLKYASDEGMCRPLKSQIYKVKEEISRQKESEIRKYGIN